MRDIPFWFCFAALGALVGLSGKRAGLREMRAPMLGATLLAYIIYAAVRLSGLGDAADYDSVAFFGYAALLCIVLLALESNGRCSPRWVRAAISSISGISSSSCACAITPGWARWERPPISRSPSS